MSTTDHSFEYSDDGWVSDDERETGSEKRPVALTKAQLLIASPSVKGYALKTKRWRKSCSLASKELLCIQLSDCPPVTFYIKSVREIEWSDGAFKSLVLPADQKELVLAFAESQVKHKETFDDVIQGKGSWA